MKIFLMFLLALFSFGLSANSILGYYRPPQNHVDYEYYNVDCSTGNCICDDPYGSILISPPCTKIAACQIFSRNSGPTCTGWVCCEALPNDLPAEYIAKCQSSPSPINSVPPVVTYPTPSILSPNPQPSLQPSPSTGCREVTTSTTSSTGQQLQLKYLDCSPQ